jgi:putative membrane protein
MHILLHLVVLTVTVLAIARLIPAVEVKSWKTAAVVAVVFSVLNFLLGWLIHALLFVPALLTLGLLFFFIPFIVNTAMLWVTDKLIGDFEIKSGRALLYAAAIITVMNWLFEAAFRTHRHLPHFQRW